jgi:hypothetical protein
MVNEKHQWQNGPTKETNKWLSNYDMRTCELDKIGFKYNCDKCNTQRTNLNGKEVAIPGHNYTEIYENIFKSKKTNKIKILEIGMGNYPTNGYSLRMWCEYFPNIELHIVDINPHNFYCNFEYDKSKVFFHILDQSNADELIKFREKFEQNSFDYIIDDGSHIAAHQILSLHLLFNYLLKDDGIYFIEDLHDSSIMNYIPGLFKCLNQNHLLDSEPNIQDSLNVSSIHFYRSLIYLIKGDKITR